MIQSEGAEKVNGYDTTKYSVDTSRADTAEQGLYRATLGSGGFEKGTWWVTADGCPVKLSLDSELHSNKAAWKSRITRRRWCNSKKAFATAKEGLQAARATRFTFHDRRGQECRRHASLVLRAKSFDRLQARCFERRPESADDPHERKNHKRRRHHIHRRAQEDVAVVVHGLVELAI